MPITSERQKLTEKLNFLGQMGSTETALFHQKVASSLGLGITDIKTITILIQEGSMTAGEIATRLNLTAGAVTNVIDRLEKRSITQRVADIKDRRKVIVEINDNTMQNISLDAYESMGRAHAQLLESYTIEQLSMLVSYHEKQIEATRQEITKLGTKKKSDTF